MKVDVLGVKIDALSKVQVINAIRNNLNSAKRIFIVTPYSESIVAAQKDAEFKNILNSADITLPDGIGILWAAHYLKFGKLIRSLLSIIYNPKFLRDPIPEKISGTDFVWDLARLAAEKRYSIFLLGGYGDTPRLVAEKLKSKYPTLQIYTLAPRHSASRSGSRTTSSWPRGGRGEGEGVIQQINNSNADFLFVALGPIRQEKWIYKNLPKLRVKLAIGLGGTFDYLAGEWPLAPQNWRYVGLEWLWRLLTQPWRVWRISKGVLGLIWYSAK